MEEINRMLVSEDYSDFEYAVDLLIQEGSSIDKIREHIEYEFKKSKKNLSLCISLVDKMKPLQRISSLSLWTMSPKTNMPLYKLSTFNKINLDES